MAHLSGTDRLQLLLLPKAVDDYVGPDNPVRFIEAFVDGLDLAAAGFERVAAKDTGRPGFDPADMLKLYIYGYLNRVRSSRRLEAEAHRNIEVIWLLRHLKPDCRTIAAFRRVNSSAFRKVVERSYNAIEAAYPPGFGEHYDRLKNGDARGVEMAIEFLEADPWFFRSGYIKANLARFLKHVTLSNQQVRRLEKVLFKIADERNTQEFRNYCRLARTVATPALIEALKKRLTDDNIHRRLRATWMLFAIEQDSISRNP
jgi:transposase